MLVNLEKALRAKNISIKGYADFLGVSEKTIRNKIAGITDFSYPEVRRTKDDLFPEYDIGFLFKPCSVNDLSSDRGVE